MQLGTKSCQAVRQPGSQQCHRAALGQRWVRVNQSLGTQDSRARRQQVSSSASQPPPSSLPSAWLGWGHWKGRKTKKALA